MICIHKTIFIYSMASRIKGETYEIENKNYRICSVIGQGSFANVFLAKNMQDNQYYALKIMKQYRDQQKQLIDEEINIQKKFEGNKHVIQYLGQKLLPGGSMCLVLELGECSLKNWLELTKQVSQKQLLNIITQTLEGLGSVHNNGVIHRDIKPENIIKKNNIYKITDFGVSYQGEQDTTITGTPLYWAPEMIRSALGDQEIPLTKKFDVWALGATIFEVYFKVNPFFPYNRQQYAGTKPIKLARIIWENIERLTPQFTMQKFIKFLKQNKLDSEAEFVIKKLKKTNQVIIESLCSNFFERNPNIRPDCSQMLQLFQMLKDSLVVQVAKKTKTYPKWSMNEVPEDIKIFCEAKDLFYVFSQQFKTKYDQRVLFCLELGIWYLQGAIYGGVNYIVLDKMQQIKPYRKPPPQLWSELKSKLSQYYFSLKSQEQYRDFDKLVYLKLYILVCSIWWSIIKDETQYFCKMIEQVTGLEISHPIHIFTHIELYSDKCINDIEDALISRYYI